MRNLRGVPVYINPLIGPDKIVRHLVGTGQEHVIVDSVETYERLKKRIVELLEGSLKKLVEYPGVEDHDCDDDAAIELIVNEIERWKD